MSTIKLASWNVNGIRSAWKKGFSDWLLESNADIVAIQESKISADQLTSELVSPSGYTSFWSHAQKRGYSGVALYVREKPIKVEYGLGIKKFDDEGRTIIAEYPSFTLFNIYFPNGKAHEQRLKYKMDFYAAFLKRVKKLAKSSKPLVICGDLNTAHKEIDLARPKDNLKTSGFLPEERAWMDSFLKAGFTDSFRLFNQDPHNYTWWHMRTFARERNVGWRIDYFFVSNNLVERLVDATIENKVLGSDHCPVTITLME
ncbi:MAG: exodeoxyribonuclease III [Candidatus Obscuribacterales bacterium]|nr:exodeoxyribonuclease III [Candidatus Obscuribacterales bacterium]